jgi:hypothetical protein
VSNRQDRSQQEAIADIAVNNMLRRSSTWFSNLAKMIELGKPTEWPDPTPVRNNSK